MRYAVKEVMTGPPLKLRGPPNPAPPLVVMVR